MFICLRGRMDGNFGNHTIFIIRKFKWIFLHIFFWRMLTQRWKIYGAKRLMLPWTSKTGLLPINHYLFLIGKSSGRYERCFRMACWSPDLSILFYTNVSMMKLIYKNKFPEFCFFLTYKPCWTDFNGSLCI